MHQFIAAHRFSVIRIGENSPPEPRRSRFVEIGFGFLQLHMEVRNRVGHVVFGVSVGHNRAFDASEKIAHDAILPGDWQSVGVHPAPNRANAAGR
jgi:hypothetical protein